MKCEICKETCGLSKQFCPKHLSMLREGWTLNGWTMANDGTFYQGSTKKLDEADVALNQTVRQGRAHGKNINNLRSQFKNGKWNYKYIK